MGDMTKYLLERYIQQYNDKMIKKSNLKIMINSTLKKSSYAEYKKFCACKKFCAHKKSQAATEFLVTYGWAILGVMIVIAALAYFGIFDTQKYIKDECSLGNQLYCEDFYLNTNGKLNITLRNNYGVSIVVRKIFFTNEFNANSVQCSSVSPPTLEPGDTVDRECSILGILGSSSFQESQKVKMKVTVQFNRVAAGSSGTHNVTGTIIATAQN